MCNADATWLVFLWTKPKPRLIGQRCSNHRMPDEAAGLQGFAPTSGEMLRCTKPVWGDGKGVHGRGAGLCSRCWRSLHLVAVDPVLDQVIAAPVLPPLVADTFPVDWL